MGDNQSSALEMLADDLQGEVAQAIADLAKRRNARLSEIGAQFDAMQANATDIVDQFSQKAEALATTIEGLAPGFDKHASDLATASTTFDTLLVNVQAELTKGLNTISAVHQAVDVNFRAKEVEVGAEIDQHNQLITDTGLHLADRHDTAAQSLADTATVLQQLSQRSQQSQQGTISALQQLGSNIMQDFDNVLQNIDKNGDDRLADFASNVDSNLNETQGREQSVASVANGLVGDWDGLGSDYQNKINDVMSKIEDVMRFLEQIEPLLKLAKELA